MTADPQAGDLWRIAGSTYALLSQSGGVWRAVNVDPGDRKGRQCLIGASVFTDTLMAHQVKLPAGTTVTYRPGPHRRCDGNEKSGTCLAREACTGPCRWFAP